MYRNRHNDNQFKTADESAPSATWSFAQAILDNPIPDPRAAAQRSQHGREVLEFAASISDRCRYERSRAQRVETQGERDRELLEWLASISEKHECELRALEREQAEAQKAQQEYERLIEALDVQEAQWDPSKHPRLGGPPNAGWFATTGGVGGSGKASGAAPKPNEVPTGDASTGAPPPAVTKPQLPAAHRGTWVSGKKGDGVFRYNDSIENQRAGLAGKEVRFENQHIAVGGLPAEAYYGGNAGAATVEIPNVTGLDSDNLAADAAMRKKLGDPKWKRPNGYAWNHAGTPGSKAMELVDERVHRAVSHKGPAAEPRALRRAARAHGATGRAMGALTVYLTARDALQAAGALQPGYEVAERETYHYVSDDGSVFVVWPSSWISSAKREFVAGPRKGQTEKISDEQLDEFRKQAEEEWGKYIPGSLFSEPRFIPGKKRTSLPLIEYRNGIPHEAGWIDEKGVHRYPSPKELPI